MSADTVRQVEHRVAHTALEHLEDCIDALKGFVDAYEAGGDLAISAAISQVFAEEAEAALPRLRSEALGG